MAHTQEYESVPMAHTSTVPHDVADLVSDSEPRPTRTTFLGSRARQVRVLGFFAAGLLVATLATASAPRMTRWLRPTSTGDVVLLAAKVVKSEGKEWTVVATDSFCDKGVMQFHDGNSPDADLASQEACQAVCEKNSDCKFYLYRYDKDAGKKYGCAIFSECSRTHTFTDGDGGHIWKKPEAGEDRDDDKDDSKADSQDEDEDEGGEEAEGDEEDDDEDEEDGDEDEDDDGEDEAEEDTDDDGADDLAEEADADEDGPKKGVKCAGTWEGCLESKCCEEAGMQCYKKDDYWAICKGNCTPGVDPETHDEWNCGTVGSRNWKMARPPQSRKGGFPSLFCFTTMSSKEVKLVKHQVAKEVGIFACDEFAVVSQTAVKLGKLPNGGVWGKVKDPVETIEVPDVKVALSDDGTVLNAEVFFEVWKAIGEDGRYEKHDWTIKTDPDTVLLPDRLRVHLKSQTFANAAQYVKNCELKSERKPVKKLAPAESDDKESDAKSDKKSDAKSEEKAEAKSGDESVANPEENSTSKSEANSTEKAGANSTEKAGANSTEKAEANSTEKAAAKPGEKSGAKAEEKPEADAGEAKGRRLGSKKKRNPSMLGALEVYSVEAVRLYTDGVKGCKRSLKWETWGEDVFMEHCMEFLAVSVLAMENMLLDDRCTGRVPAKCTDPWAAAFHDFKTTRRWEKCWRTTQ